MKYDEIIGHLGDFGRYQRRVYLMLSVPLFFTAWHLLVQVFLAGESDHWCADDVIADQECPPNVTAAISDPIAACESAKRAYYIPVEGAGDPYSYAHCTKYEVTGSAEEGVFLISNQTIPCDEGWVYDRSQYKSTIIMDFDLVCGRKSYPEISQSIFFAGIMCGSVLVGYTADKIGRFYALYLTIGLTSVFGVVTCLSNSLWMYTMMRFSLGAFNYGCMTTAFIAATELIGRSKRVMAGVLIQLFFAFGFIALAGLASVIRKWRLLQLSISLMPLITFAFFPFIPESPRWLLSQNRKEEAMKILEKMSKVNNVPLLKMDDLEDDEEADAEVHTILDILKSRILTIRVIVMMSVWFVHNIVYYGLALSSADFGVSVYKAFLLAGLVELPAYALAGVAMEMVGRRPSTFWLMMLGGVSCLAVPFVPLGAIRATVAMIGKFGISASFALVYVWAVEIFPTPLRANSLGMCTFASQSGGIFSPLITLLANTWLPFPYVIFGVLALAAGVASLLLPETKGQLMPETIADAEALGRRGMEKIPTAEPEL